MSSKKTLYLCGAGNSEGVRLALRVNGVARRWERLVILDDDPEKRGKSLLGVEIAGPFDLLGEAEPISAEVVSLVARTTDRRVAANEKIEAFGIPFATLIHPGVDTLGAETNPGVLVYDNAILSPNTVVGEHSVVLMGAAIGHESRVDRFCVVAAGSVLNARVHLEERVYIGTNASILPELTVGCGATIGANSSVIRDVPAGATAVGVPAQVLLGPNGGQSGAATRTPMDRAQLEEAILAIWQSVLGEPDIGIEENFFDLGGTSQQALVVGELIRVATGRDIAVTDMYRFSTIAAFAAHLSEQSGVSPNGVPASPRAEVVAPPAVEPPLSNRAEIESVICRIWEQLLGIAKVSSSDDFFNLGGTSQLALEAREQIRRATRRQISPTDIFKFPTVQGLADKIQQRAQSPSRTS